MAIPAPGDYRQEAKVGNRAADKRRWVDVCQRCQASWSGCGGRLTRLDFDAGTMGCITPRTELVWALHAAVIQWMTLTVDDHDDT